MTSLIVGYSSSSSSSSEDDFSDDQRHVSDEMSNSSSEPVDVGASNENTTSGSSSKIALPSAASLFDRGRNSHGSTSIDYGISNSKNSFQGNTGLKRKANAVSQPPTTQKVLLPPQVRSKSRSNRVTEDRDKWNSKTTNQIHHNREKSRIKLAKKKSETVKTQQNGRISHKRLKA